MIAIGHIVECRRMQIDHVMTIKTKDDGLFFPSASISPGPGPVLMGYASLK